MTSPFSLPLAIALQPQSLMFPLAMGRGVKSSGVRPSLPAPVYGLITATADGSTGQKYTLNASWTDVQWYRMAPASPYALTAIAGATALNYVAQAADEWYRLAARGKLNGVDVAAKALHVVLPPPIMLENFESLSGFVATAGAVLTIENADVANGSGKLVVEGTGVANTGFTKADIGSYDPASWGTVAQFFDVGWGPTESATIALNFTRGSTSYPSAVSYPLSPLFQTPAPLFYGKMWSSRHISEFGGLDAVGPGTLGIKQIMAGASSNHYYGKKSTDALLAKAGGRPTIIIGFDDCYDTQYSIAFQRMKALGIVAGCAIAKDYIDQPDRLTTAMYQEMYDNGWDAYLNTTDDAPLTGKGSIQAALDNLEANRQFCVSKGWTRGNRFGAIPNGSYQNAATRPATTMTSTGNNVVTVASATNIVVGMTMAGYGIPADLTVQDVSGTTITLSGNVPSMNNRGVNFVDLRSPFSYTKLPLAMKAAGHLMYRTTQNRGGFLTRFGIGDRGGILTPGNGLSGITLDAIKAMIDLAILRGETIELYIHGINSSGGVHTDEAKWNGALEYIASKRDAGVADPMTKSQVYARDGGASVPKLAA